MSETNPTAPVAGHVPSLHGRYDIDVSIDGDTLSMTTRFVERRWMPISLFGRIVEAKLIPIPKYPVVILHCDDGVVMEDCRGVSGGDVPESKSPCASTANPRQILISNRWSATVRESAYEKLASAVHTKSPAMTLRVHGIGVVIVSFIFLYLLAGLLSSKGASSHATSNGGMTGMPSPVVSQAGQADSRTPDIDPAQMSSAIAAQRAVEKDGSSLPIKEAVDKAFKIVLRPSKVKGKGIIVWSDPLCPHCRDLERSVIDGLAPDMGITIIPVAFKDGARPLVSYLVCGPDGKDNAQRWTSLLAAQPKAHLEMQCDAGPGVADLNSILFARAGLRGTPAIMTETGDRVYPGDPSTLTSSQVEQWVKQ